MAYDDGFHDDVTPPHHRPTAGSILGGTLIALVLICGLIGALLLARPALDVDRQSVPDAPEAAEGR
ncbi:hypothetical protein [Streptomyces sp. NBC_01803]|uniref:hypothetical protein n=1 Tax=Streptomyces sp. NBC_01803 TaxID=2975946 RepID=UPI002DD84B51|nr:hypothetical protein [Streptomyces sp. NBC_01803]WSA43906.1 hypothetical protein OIE51_06665 [Streptomyces sp. NBC_01803]